jgi:hypothetical protein
MALRIIAWLMALFFYGMAGLSFFTHSVVLSGKSGRTSVVTPTDSPGFYWAAIAAYLLFGSLVLSLAFLKKQPKAGS